MNFNMLFQFLEVKQDCIVLSNSEFILQRFREVFEGCPVVGQISIAVKNQRAE